MLNEPTLNSPSAPAALRMDSSRYASSTESKQKKNGHSHTTSTRGQPLGQPQGNHRATRRQYNTLYMALFNTGNHVFNREFDIIDPNKWLI